MHGQSHIFLLTYMVAVAIPVSVAFNIDVTDPHVYTGEQKDFFGYKVLQFISGKSKGIIVTAPLRFNGSGGICKLDRDQTHNCFEPGESPLKNSTIQVKHLGLSIAEDSRRSQFTVCSPSVAHECNENSYVNSVCYKMTDDLKQLSSFTPNFQVCAIFQMEGSKVARSENLTNEMSQSGFSAAFYKDTLILGSVLSNSWHGSLQVIQGNIQTQIEDPQMHKDSYMGFSISVGEKNKAPLYFTGAPRFEHTGQVVLFRHDCKNWIAAQRVNGDQGAVYIYLGDRQRGIRSTFSQRILGQKIKPGLRFFGQAIDEDLDLGEDGLPNIVIGSQGTAVVLRSRPVVNVMAHLSFQPEEISTEEIDCLGSTDDNLPMVTLTACFEMVEITKSKAGAMSSGLTIRYVLDVDPMRQTHRGFFSQTDEKARNLTSTYTLRDKDTCFSYSIYMPKCVKDTLSPIRIKSNFSQVDSKNISTVLNVDSKKQAVVEIPFEKHCRKNDTCIAELEVDFILMTQTLLVAEDNYFNLSIKLSNHGDDSYNTSLSMHYPPGLSFSMMTVTEATRSTPHSCNGLEGVLDKTICGISLPVYRSRSVATFKTSFHIMTEREWNDTVLITITGKSDNANSTSTNSLTKSIPVQFAIKMVVTVKEDTTTYLNFTTEDTAPKKLVAIYEISNPGWKSFPVNVSLIFPAKLEHNFEIENSQVFVKENKTQCTGMIDTKSEHCSPDTHCKSIVCNSFILDKESATEFRLSGDVQFKDLKHHAENIAFFKRYTGDSADVKFKSFMQVRYDNQRYVLDSHKQEEKPAAMRKDNNPVMKSVEVRVEFVIPPDKLLIILTGVVLGLLLLIIITIIMFKLGCFKRKTLEYYQEQEEEAATQADTPTEITPTPTNGTVNQSEAASKPDQPAEETKLLEEDEENAPTQSADV
ncbi:integrin alpha-M [Morone saxatilis]|uniref:integrin alpha-M n=1 Tax=Morone saxatilis TaxID=34816 RepID=UPI0015E1F82F|nr:integrin alpha-M [Morone saxatilis]